MKVLYVGGTGQISFDCVHESVRAGHETWVFNRGNSNAGLPSEVRFITGDFEDDAAYGVIAEHGFDVVCQFRVFGTDKLRRDIDLLAGKIGQYVFISSASAYQKPVTVQFITEDVPLENPYWEYSRNKAACEALLGGQSALPWTIVRPSHTSRDMLIDAMGGGDRVAARMLRGQPVVVHGDGTSLWTVTASADFAPPFVKLLGNDVAFGEDFHLTADHAYSWNTLYTALGAALGVTPDLVHVPTATLVKYHPDWEGPLWGDKSWSAQFDNRKIKSVVGDFVCGTALDRFMADRVAAFRRRGGADAAVDAEMDALFDRIAADQRSLPALP
ncbi:MAG: NAD-dependent epimerase/dehydratase family protein [Planctomycetota bacterium]